MPQIRYIGKKDRKEDNVAGTGIVWEGEDDVQDVEDQAAANKLLQYPDVWELAEGKPAKAPAKPVEPAAAKAGDDKNATGKAAAKTSGAKPAAKPAAKAGAKAGKAAKAGDDKNAMSEADAKPPLANLENMDKDQLTAYAQQHFGHSFEAEADEAGMRNTIIGLMNRG